MKRLLKGSFWAFCLLVFGPAARAADPTLLILGDSLSAAYNMPIQQGWVSLLERRLKAQGYTYKVLNASVSGATSADALSWLELAAERAKPAISIVWLGANDGLRGQPLEQLERNLSRIVEFLQGQGSRVLLLPMRLPPNYGVDYADGFAVVYGRLAARYDVPLGAFLLEDVILQPGLMQPDGLHPRAEAQPRLLEGIWPSLKPLLDRSVAP